MLFTNLYTLIHNCEAISTISNISNLKFKLSFNGVYNSEAIHTFSKNKKLNSLDLSG